MSQPVNLRQARKLRDRAKKRAQADANAALHGRSKSQRAKESAQATRLRDHLDAHRREHADDAPD
jgi:hypothetical protein